MARSDYCGIHWGLGKVAFFYRDYLIAVLFGILLDVIFGDPKWLYHPVQAIGLLISFLEKKLLRESDIDNIKRLKGGILAAFVIIVTGVGIPGLPLFV